MAAPAIGQTRDGPDRSPLKSDTPSASPPADQTLWDSSWLLSEESWPGRVLHVLIGYVDRPTLIQAVAYLATVAAILFLATARRAPAPAREARS